MNEPRGARDCTFVPRIKANETSPYPAHLLGEMMKRLTPVVYVEEIESVLPFWVDRLGFQITAEVSEGDRLGFVILQKGHVQVMYQTRESVVNDIPQIADAPMGGTFLFIQVDDINAIERALEGISTVVPRRMTFYGADEIIVREPAGNVVTFAEFREEAPSK